MKVEIWSDVMCPFCYIGKRRFEEAMARFPHREQVEVFYRSFELDPSSPRDVGHDVYDMLSRKYGMSREQAIEMNENMKVQAQAVGLEFVFDTMVLTNTFDAHRLIHFAAAHSKMQEMTERLFRAFFTESQHVGDHAVLSTLAEEVGLERSATEAVLAGEQFTDAVRKDEQEARSLGINGVPFFLIDRKFAVSGAQKTEVLLQALTKAYEEQPKLTFVQSEQSEAGSCTDGSCTPNK